MKKILIYFIGILLYLIRITSCEAGVRFHFINVGHGDAILIEKEGEGLALVDGGTPDAGVIVLDYLRAQGIQKLDHLFVTHSHNDHCGGALVILDSLEIIMIHHTGMVHDWEPAATFQRMIQSGKWLVDVTDAGDVPVQDDELTIEVLSPLKEEVNGKPADPNPNSMVLLVNHGEVKVLLTADIYSEREKWLIDRFGDRLKCQAMKASHHASKKGNCKEFLQAVRPDVIVVTVGPNDWGYPLEKTIQRLQKHCPEVLRTDKDGAVILRSDGKTLTVEKPGDERI